MTIERMYAIIDLLPSPILVQEGGIALDILISFIISVIAGVVAYYICEWLDGEE